MIPPENQQISESSSSSVDSSASNADHHSCREVKNKQELLLEIANVRKVLDKSINQRPKKNDAEEAISALNAIEKYCLELCSFQEQKRNQQRPQRPSYASAVSSTEPGNHVFIIEPKNKQESSTTMQEFKRIVNPAECKVAINICKPISGGRVVVNTKSLEDEIKIRAALLNDSDTIRYDFKKPAEKRYRVSIKDVNTDVKFEEILPCATAQNPHFQATEENFRPLFECKKRAANSNTRDIVVLVSRDVRKALLKCGLHVGFQKAKIRDYVRPTQCFNCHALGHIAKFCRTDIEKLICGHCGGNHKSISCGDKKLRFKITQCINCDGHNKKCGDRNKLRETNHSPYEKCCLTLSDAYDKERDSLSRLDKC